MGNLACTLIAPLLLSMCEQGFSGETEEDRAKSYLEAQNRINFVGWEGILFYCYTGTKDPDPMLDEICNRSFVNADFLTASAKIKLQRGKSSYHSAFAAALGEQLVLLLKLNATDQTRAVAVTLKAYTLYSGSVVGKREVGEELREVSHRRSGDLVLWERNAVASSTGGGRELIAPLTEAIEVLLKQFFADYLKAQQ